MYIYPSLTCLTEYHWTPLKSEVSLLAAQQRCSYPYIMVVAVQSSTCGFYLVTPFKPRKRDSYLSPTNNIKENLTSN